MKFDYKFKRGDKVRIKNRPEDEVYTINARYGGYNVPAYRLGGCYTPVLESDLILVENFFADTVEEKPTAPTTPDSVEDTYRDFLEELNQRVSALSSFARNLNLLSLNGKLAPTYNRDSEIARIKTTLLRRMTPNPLLTGAAGCGKTAIVEEVAHSFVEEALTSGNFQNIPVIYDLSLGALLSGTRYRGDFEERLNQVVNVVKRYPNIIIFIDEIHMINTTGNAEGAISAGQQLKPALARGEIRCIGATTDEEYSKYIANDKALARRFSLIKINPLTGKAQTDCIKNIIAEYGKYFNINVDGVTIETMQMIIKDIIPDTTFPNNVISILDETLATAKFNQQEKIDDSDVKKIAGQQHNVIIL